MYAQHDALRELARRYREELAREAPDLVALADCRWRLLRLVTGHLAYEDAHLRPLLARTPQAVVHARMANELGQLFARFQNHVREWTAPQMAADWIGFRAQAGALLDALAMRMDHEERELYAPFLMAKSA